MRNAIIKFLVCDFFSFRVAFCLIVLLLPIRTFDSAIWATARRRLDVVSRTFVVTSPLFFDVH